MSYGIIKEHAGKIDVRSTPGQGHVLPPGIPRGAESGSCLKAPSWSSTTKPKFAKAWNFCSNRKATAHVERRNRRSRPGAARRKALRSAAARRQPARPQRPRPAARNPPARPEPRRRPDHRVRLDRHGARRVQERRAGLHHQAVVQRRTAACRSRRPSKAAACAKKTSSSSAR